VYRTEAPPVAVASATLCGVVKVPPLGLAVGVATCKVYTPLVTTLSARPVL
jgi:hypothetical protein